VTALLLLMQALLWTCLGVFGDRQGVHRAITDASPVVIESHHDELTSVEHHIITQYKKATGIPVSTQLSDLLQKWDAFALGFDYWLYAGTLLGQHCRKGVLHGDDDADVAMMENDFYRLALTQLHTHHKNAAFQLIVRAGLHSDIIAGKFVNTKTGVYIDVVLFHNTHPMQGNSDIVHYWSNSVCFACKTNPARLVLARKDVWPLKKCQFENASVSCPRRVEKMCKAMYKSPFYNC
tara:strand:+ start:333 stop:1040 length:708 start_codon:yes stop_codon:yes gene_type:complete